MLNGFKEFILRGNVIELAVAVIIGASFKAIVDKFVEGIVNPALGAIVGQPNFDDALIVGPLHIGLVLTALVNFLMVSAVIYFLMVMPMNRLMERMKKPEPEPEPAEPSDEVKLLTEIRDALKKK